jgi:hypothetical protein
MMRRSTALGIAVALLTLGLDGCAGLRIDTYARRDVDFRQYRTYEFGTTTNFWTGDPRLDNNPFVQEHLKQAVESRLAARGLEKATDSPHLRVRYFAGVNQAVDINGYGEDRGDCEGCEPFVYESGDIVLDFIDARTNRLVWRGWAEGSLDGMIDDQELLEKRIEDAVSRIMEKLPLGS